MGRGAGIHFPFAGETGVGNNVTKWCLDHTVHLRSK